jgi:hypothetical protein
MVKNKIKKIVNSLEIAATLAIAGISLLPAKILADDPVGLKRIDPADPTNFSVDKMLGKIQGYFFGIIVVACIFMILWGGLDIATAGDNEQKLEGAKKRIKYAIIGLIVAAMATAIVSLLMNVTEVKTTTD